MQKFKSLLFPVLAVLLAGSSVLGSFFTYLIFPGVALLLWFLVHNEAFRSEIKVAIAGACLFLIFLSWDYLLFDKFSFLFALILTLALMAAMEAWKFTSLAESNVWGLMNLVVFWIAMEYIMLVWLPFDISKWLIGAPLMLNESTGSNWILYTGKQGYSLWVLLVAMLFYKSFLKRGINIILILCALLLIALPVLLNFNFEGNEYVAQGEWIGRTAVWVAVLILVYSFVKNKTQKKR